MIKYERIAVVRVPETSEYAYDPMCGGHKRVIPSYATECVQVFDTLEEAQKPLKHEIKFVRIDKIETKIETVG